MSCVKIRYKNVDGLEKSYNGKLKVYLVRSNKIYSFLKVCCLILNFLSVSFSLRLFDNNFTNSA